ARVFVHSDGTGLAAVLPLGLGDEDRIARPAYVRPIKPQRLADPQALPAQHRRDRLRVLGVALHQPVSLMWRQEAYTLVVDPLAARQLGWVEPLLGGEIVHRRLE